MKRERGWEEMSRGHPPSVIHQSCREGIVIKASSKRSIPYIDHITMDKKKKWIDTEA
jgi:hypothetical protein